MAGRPRVLDAEGEATLDAILEAGLDQASAAAALGISIRSVQRYEAARRRRSKPPQDLDSLLAALADTPIEQALDFAALCRSSIKRQLLGGSSP